MDRNLQIIGMAKKAGLLAVGADATYSAARTRKAWLIITTNDASESALRRARHSAEAGGVLHVTVPYSGFELGNVSGRGSPLMVAILDAGLAASFLKGLATLFPESYGAQADLAAQKAHAQQEKRKKNVKSGNRRAVQ